MFCYFDQNFIEKICWKKRIKFWSRDFILEMNFCFCVCFVAVIFVVLDVYRYGQSFVQKFQQESTQFQFAWVEVEPPPIVHKRE